VNENAFLQRVVLTKKSVHLDDTRDENEWREHKAFSNVRSWLAVPLVSSEAVLGLLSIGSAKAGFFTTEHFRWQIPRHSSSGRDSKCTSL